MNTVIENVVKTVQNAQAWDDVRNEMRSLAFRAGLEDEWNAADSESRFVVAADIEDVLHVDLMIERKE